MVLDGAAALASLDLIAKALAEAHLTSGGTDGGVIQLRPAHNGGVAFGLGNALPAPVIVTSTAAICAVLVNFAWRHAPAAGRLQRLAGAAVVGGAIADLIDRAADGEVTDYLHTGWWPTFHLADTLVVGGILLLAAAVLRADWSDGDAHTPRRPTGLGGAGTR